MTKQPMRRLCSPLNLLVLTVALLNQVAWAQDVPDLGKLAGFIRWGGVVLSVVVILGAIVLGKLISGIAERLSV